MFLKSKILLCAGILAMADLMSGCTSAHLVEVWNDSSWRAESLKSILVVAVRKDPISRRIWEDAFTEELVLHGVAATPSYRLFADGPPDSLQIEATVASTGYDGTVEIVRRPTEVSIQQIPCYTTTEQGVRYGTYGQRYRSYYREIEHAGYVDSQSVAINEIFVTTNGNNGRLIWTGTSRTPDSASKKGVQKKNVHLVIEELVSKGIVNSWK